MSIVADATEKVKHTTKRPATQPKQHYSIDTWEDAYHLAMAAGHTAATCHCHTRTWGMKWSTEDRNHAVDVVVRTMRAFGYGPCPGTSAEAWDRVTL